MGLDIVELIISTEERFGIEIPDRDAGKLTTVRELVEYVWPKVKHDPYRRCVSQREFYRLRRALISRQWVTRCTLTPDTPLERIVPKTNRNQLWTDVARELQTSKLDFLEWPPFVGFLVVLVASLTLLFAWIALSMATNFRSFWITAVSSVATITVMWLSFAAGRPYRSVFPAKYATVGPLVEFLTTSRPRSEEIESGWTPETVRLAVREVVAKQSGVAEFADDAKFVHDLGMD